MAVKPALARNALGTLQGLIALSAFGGGWYGWDGAEAIPLAWLDGSVFPTYVIPGLFLFVVIGGFFLAGSILTFAGKPSSRALAYFTAILLAAWIAVQVSIIGWVSWLQPAMVGAAALTALLARRLPIALITKSKRRSLGAGSMI